MNKMRAKKVGRPALSKRERGVLLRTTREFVESVEGQTGARAAELALHLLHDGKRGKFDLLTDSELARDWSVLRGTVAHPRWLSRRRLMRAMEIAAEHYGWRDREGVLAVLECNDDYMDALAAAARRHDNQHQREVEEQWLALSGYLMDRYRWSDQEFFDRLGKVRAATHADDAVVKARIHAITSGLPPPQPME